MKRINDAVAKITSKNESAVLGELLHKVTKSRLSAISIKIIGFVEDNILTSPLEGHSGGERHDLVSEGVDVAVHRPVDDDVVAVQLIEHCPGHRRLTDASRAREYEVGNVLVVYELLKGCLQLVRKDRVSNSVRAVLLHPQKFFVHVFTSFIVNIVILTQSAKSVNPSCP